MEFKYFNQPESFACFVDEPTACDTCRKETTCFDATLFFGESEMEAICPECLAAGKLINRKIYTCTGDAAALKSQLKTANPALTDAEVSKLSKQMTTTLEKTNPHLVTWQDWDWPAADGDYCRFIGYGSKPLYEKLAGSADPKDFFEASVYYNIKEDTDADMLWKNDMPEKEVNSYDDSSQYATLFYVFKSLHSGTIVTIWDCE